MLVPLWSAPLETVLADLVTRPEASVDRRVGFTALEWSDSQRVMC
jgi:hypothetical protein